MSRPIKAKEQGTFIVTAAFYDDQGDSVAPDSMFWSLVDKDENVINEREDVEIASPETTEDIVLHGDDLAILAGYSEEERYLVLEGTYTSDAGNGLPITGQLKFYVVNLKKVA